MAVSLGFGVIFATVVTLLLIPSLFVILEDALGTPETEPENHHQHITG
jgi:predicted RND superfamily exporter protein